MKREIVKSLFLDIPLFGRLLLRKNKYIVKAVSDKEFCEWRDPKKKGFNSFNFHGSNFTTSSMRLWQQGGRIFSWSLGCATVLRQKISILTTKRRSRNSVSKEHFKLSLLTNSPCMRTSESKKQHSKFIALQTILRTMIKLYHSARS